MSNEIEKLKYQIYETERKIKEISIKLKNIVQDYTKNITPKKKYE